MAYYFVMDKFYIYLYVHNKNNNNKFKITINTTIYYIHMYDALKSSLRMPVTFQVSADISTELVLNIQSTLYRYPNYVKELNSI